MAVPMGGAMTRSAALREEGGQCGGTREERISGEIVAGRESPVRRKYVLFVLMVLFALVLAMVLAGPASAGAKTGFSTTATMTDWTFDDYTELYAGPTVQGSGDVRTFRDVSDDPRLSGWTVFSVNRFRMLTYPPYPPYFIVGHATYRTETLTGDVWEGTVTIKANATTGVASLTAEGHGVSGSVTGLTVKWTALEFSFVQERTGYIIEK